MSELFKQIDPDFFKKHFETVKGDYSSDSYPKSLTDLLKIHVTGEVPKKEFWPNILSVSYDVTIDMHEEMASIYNQFKNKKINLDHVQEFESAASLFQKKIYDALFIYGHGDMYEEKILSPVVSFFRKINPKLKLFFLYGFTPGAERIKKNYSNVELLRIPMVVEDFFKVFNSLSKNYPSEDRLAYLLESAGVTYPEFVEKIDQYHTENVLSGGFSSRLVIGNGEVVLKIADKNSIENELLVYDLEMPAMSNYMPRMVDGFVLDDLGIVGMSNLENEVSGYQKSGIYDPILHNLYLMGLFHKGATPAVKEQNLILPKLDYSAYDGFAHHISIVEPRPNFSKSELRNFRIDNPYDLIKQVDPVINEVCSYIQEEGDVVILDDWKLENVVNGHVMDFGFVRWGKEIEDITYFLSEMKLGLTHNKILGFVDAYIGLRSQHDKKFAHDSKRHNEMRQYATPNRLKELAIRAGVRRKREQTDLNASIRRYYINEMRNVYSTLRGGK